MTTQIVYPSIYIPYSYNLTESQIKDIFWFSYLGDVKRVDFIINSSGNKGAFVHLSKWYNNYIVEQVLNEIYVYGSFKHWYGPSGYIILRKMTSEPIPETEMNIHQLAFKISEQQNTIQQLLEKINRFESKNEAQIRQHKIWVYERDTEMEKMVSSLVGPRFTEEDDADKNCVAVIPDI
jgi:hypothetical protein